MQHIVKIRFKDLEDGDHIYEIGDVFPHKGKATKKRLEELLGKDNKLGKPVLEEVEAVKEAKDEAKAK